MLNVKSFLRMAVVSGVLGAAAAVSGQNIQVFGGDGPGGSAQEPPVNSKQVSRYADLLGFAADQKEAATALLEGMQTEWEAGSKKMRDEMEAIREEFQETRDTSIWTDRLPAMMRKQRESRTKMEQSFMGDFKSLLSDEQQGKWGIVERVYRRDTTIPRGRLSGESVDLVRLADELPLSEPAKSAAKSTLDQYEADIDRALVERNEIVDEAQKLVGDGPAAIERAMQDEEFMKLREKAREARLKVRETNQRYARQLASALPADEAAKFNEEFTRRSFPDVYRKSLTAESLSAAEGFEDLTPEQKQQINAMRESYAAEVERANKALMEATEKYEATSEGYASALGGMTFRMRGPPGGGEDESKSTPVDEARSAKREVEKKALDNLKGILSDGQRERLPKRRERGQGGPRAMGGANGGVFLAGPGGEEDERVEDGNVVHVMRQVEIGPDGKPVEATAVFVQKIGPDGEGAEGDEEGDEVVIEVHQKETGGEPEEAPKPE